jgi:tRNA A-37 threonylcarbamoyl transferase component Bud32
VGAAAEPPRTAPEVPPELARRWAAEWPRWFGPERTPLAGAADKPWIARVETALGTVVAKRSPAAGWKRTLVVLGARRPRADRAFDAARSLLAHGLATPAPLAVLGPPDDRVLVTRYVEGSGPWELFARTPPAVSQPPLPPILGALAAALARLHGAGFRHRDLKASNVLLAGAPEAPEVCWTDLDGLRHVGTAEPRLRARDLARLGTSFESAPARAAGVRAHHWPALLRAYLTEALGREPSEAELGRLLARTAVWRKRWIRRHLAAGKPVL